MAFKVGLLVVATNKYIDYVFPLLESVKSFFLPGEDITMFVFTDKVDDPRFAAEAVKKLEFEQQSVNVVPIYQQHMPWPGSTLFRYNIFDAAKEQLSKMDYLYYCDADMEFVDFVDHEIFSTRVGTIHPGFYNKPREAFTYETNPASRAYVAPGQGTVYYAGGFNGGKTHEYLNMCKVLSERIAEDYKRGIIAVWHDESHMNKYFMENPPTVSLSPSYCYPESWDLPFKKRLLALDKDHKEMRK